MSEDLNNSNSNPEMSEQPQSQEPESEDLTGLKNKVSELLGEKKQWQQKYNDIETQFQNIVGILGTKDPDALKEYRDAQERERQSRAEYEQKMSQIKSEISSQYQVQLEEINKQLNRKNELINQKLQSDALRVLHSENAGNDFESFSALLSTKFKVDFEEVNNGSGLPEYKVKSITQRNGDPIFFDGKEAKPEEILLRARQGEYGGALSATFAAWNQSSGGTLPQGIKGSNGVIRYPRSQMAQMLAKDFSGDLKRKIVAKQVEFYND